MSAHVAQGVLRPGSPTLPKYDHHRYFFSRPVASSTGSAHGSARSESTTHSTVGLDSTCSIPFMAPISSRPIQPMPQRRRHPASITSDLTSTGSAHGSARSDSTTHSTVGLDSTYASEVEQNMTPCRTKPSAKLRALGFGEYVSRNGTQSNQRKASSASSYSTLSRRTTYIPPPQEDLSRNVTPPNQRKASSTFDNSSLSTKSYIPPPHEYMAQSNHLEPASPTAASSSSTFSGRSRDRAMRTKRNNVSQSVEQFFEGQTNEIEVLQNIQTKDYYINQLLKRIDAQDERVNIQQEQINTQEDQIKAKEKQITTQEDCLTQMKWEFYERERATDLSHFEEVEKFVNQIDVLKDNNKAARTVTDTLRADIKALKNANEGLTNEISTLKKAVNKVVQDAFLQDNNEAARTVTETLRADIKALKNANEGLANEINTLQKTANKALPESKMAKTTNMSQTTQRIDQDNERMQKIIQMSQTSQRIDQDNERILKVTQQPSQRIDQGNERMPKMTKITQMSQTSQRMDQEDVTFRPSTQPQDALAHVVRELKAELEHLKLELAEANKAYENHDHSKGRRVERELRKRITQLLEAKARKGDQIYDLYDVYAAFA